MMLDVPTMQRLSRSDESTDGRPNVWAAAGTLQSPAQVRKTTDVGAVLRLSRRRGTKCSRDGRLGARDVCHRLADTSTAAARWRRCLRTWASFLSQHDGVDLPRAERTARGSRREASSAAMSEMDGFPVGVREYRSGRHDRAGMGAAVGAAAAASIRRRSRRRAGIGSSGCRGAEPGVASLNHARSSCWHCWRSNGAGIGVVRRRAIRLIFAADTWIFAHSGDRGRGRPGSPAADLFSSRHGGRTMSSIRPLITITIIVAVGVFMFTKINEGPVDRCRTKRMHRSRARRWRTFHR